MPTAEDPNRNQFEKNRVEPEHGSSSSKLFEEAYQLKSTAKNMNERLQGVAEGVVQVCNEGFDAITKHPAALARSVIKSIETIVTTTGTLARKVSAGESNEVIQEVGKAIEKAGDTYSKMTPKEQGRIIGHDILPILVPELPLFFRGAKTTEVASEVITTAQEAEESSYQIGGRLNGMGKETGKIENHLSDRDLVRKSQSKYDAGKHFNDSETEISQSGQCLPSAQFLGKLHEACEKITVNEKNFLIEKGVRIKGVRRAVDISGNVDERTKAFYDPKNRTIYIAEEIEQNRRWVPNHGTDFILKHELGHAINDLSEKSGQLISDDKLFKEAYNEDLSKLSEKQLHDLGIVNKEPWAARDEIFSELYPHTAGLTPIDNYSYAVKTCFPNCLKYLFRYLKERR